LLERLAEQGEMQRLGAAAIAVVQPRLEMQVDAVAATLGVQATPEQRANAAGALVPALLSVLAPSIPDLETHMSKSLNVTGVLEERLTAMDKQEFETVLRSIFQEDEWILITLGGVLGTAIGTLQAGLVVTTGIG
jgi:uncharacterized membrane protein YheB (UPF0754 family)